MKKKNKTDGYGAINVKAKTKMEMKKLDLHNRLRYLLRDYEKI